MILEEKEMVFTQITWGELERANSERGETTGFPLETKTEEYQCCQEIDLCNTEGVKKNFLYTISSANSGPSNLY